jgi:serine/threonine protein kinase
MAFTADDTLLNGRYQLIGSMISTAGEGQLWGANDVEEWVKSYLLKAWPFYKAKPDDVQRALWDSELRTLYQVRSTPGSEESLLQLQDVGIDHEHRCFVMVFETRGLQTLASVLAGERSSHTWLSGRTGARRELWQMLGRIADGLALLHDQQVIHRCVSPESVFLDPGEGPESCRLGGFEWSIRLGRSVVAPASRVGWETAPEALTGSTAFGPDADWFAFGMLVARCMLAIEHLNVNDPDPMVRYRLVLNQLAKAKHKLTLLEYEFIERLIAEDSTIRPTHRSEISTTIRDIVRVLQQSQSGDDPASRHIVVIDPHSRGLVSSCLERGLREMLKLEPGDAFDPNRPDHTSRLSTFLYQDFAEGATLAPIPHQDQYILSGTTMHLKIGPARGVVDSKPNWQNAFCAGTMEYATAGSVGQVSIPPGRIEFFSTKDKRALGDRLSSSPTWETVLPRIDGSRERREDQERFNEFVRITNQIDILIRDGELFRCRVTKVEETDGMCSLIWVREVSRVQEPLPMFKPDGGMAAFLFREKSSGKQDSNLIQLCSPDSESIASRSKAPFWEVDDVDILGRSAALRPAEEIPVPPKVGDERMLRTKGLAGQVLLIRRRKQAISRLARHTYLLESLSAPGQVLMDSGPVQLPVDLDPGTVDPSKLGQIKKILGVRPIYALQGPPGTGKTHMVAWLLREILEEDPVAQILITAQAHPAVDVLRAKVEQEAFKDVPKESRPLAIRLRRTAAGRADGLAIAEQGSEHQVTKELLEATIDQLETAAEEWELSAVQVDWLASCKAMLKELNTGEASLAKEFRELVKRSASITYSTTGDGDLAALADDVSYDWSIVEEAAKAHGFELALPLYLGHRWLLIGDPKQLPPYRIEDYQKAVVELDATVAALERLDGAGSLLDSDFLQRWRERTDEQRRDFGQYCKAWLKLFEQLHKLCAYHEHEGGLLTGQHRMHPDIGELVSEAYYEGRLEHYTRDPESGLPKPGILHGLTSPAALKDKAIVWLDIPAASDDPRAAEHIVPKYRNAAEAHALDLFMRSLRNDADRPLGVAVLSPYAQQVGYLRKRLNVPDFRAALKEAGLKLAPDPRRSQLQGSREDRDGFFTVDSFQGNQAEIIAVSLVRNNSEVGGKGLGFLVEAPRMNVLLSRAERLLILVGSWEFFRAQVSYVSRNPEEESTMRHLALVMDRLETWFAEGHAVRIPADLSAFDGGSDLARR